MTTALLDRDTAFLGVGHSLSGRRWRERPADPEVTRGHQTRHGMSEPVARALASRGIGIDGGESYLRPTFKALFPDPSSFADMDLAARLIVDALVAGRSTVVFADYDVDGATSAAQLIRWFRSMGATLPVYVPDRLLEGYGPSPAVFRRMKAEGVDLVITVDCGAAATDALDAAAGIGLDVVVVDHHLMREVSSSAAALVNPNRADCQSGQGVLAAAGVTFVLLAALNREARRRGLFSDRPEPNPRQWLDLVALGAICDVTQLVGFNRALAAQGLRTMSAWSNPGLAALMRVAGAKAGTAGVFEAGFILGPRINAGGRIGRADLGARLLATDDLAEADDLAGQLHLLNAERKDVEASIAEEARAIVERDSNLDPNAPVIVVANEGWHPGVIGIVASRLRETYRKPVVIIGVDRAANIGKGSGRSHPGVNLGQAVQAAFDEGLILAGGGHAMAAGLTIRPDDIPELRAFLCERLAEEVAVANACEALDIDVLASPGSARDLLGAFETLAPFGPGNPEPVFAFPDVRCENVAAVRGGHVRVSLRDSQGGRLKAIAWRAEGTSLGERLLAGVGALHLVGKLRRDDWNGADGAQLEIEDGADPRQV